MYTYIYLEIPTFVLHKVFEGLQNEYLAIIFALFDIFYLHKVVAQFFLYGDKLEAIMY